MTRVPCDIYRVAEQCGVKLLDGTKHSSAGRQPRECFCKPTLRRLGRRHGEGHLAIVLRLIVETGNDTELYAETVKAVSIVARSPLVLVDGALFEAFDRIDLGELRIWAQASRDRAATHETMASVLMWRIASPDKIRAA